VRATAWEEDGVAEIQCQRCGKSAEGLPRAPLPGPLGESVLAQTCAGCWKEWLAMQVRMINEYKLSPINPEHFEFLLGEMRGFLRLSGAPASPGANPTSQG
jgi:Fe-S cluster biosynthesis and repair protein YggX